jgi:hypothetical protein
MLQAQRLILALVLYRKVAAFMDDFIVPNEATFRGTEGS